MQGLEPECKAYAVLGSLEGEFEGGLLSFATLVVEGVGAELVDATVDKTRDCPYVQGHRRPHDDKSCSEQHLA